MRKVAFVNPPSPGFRKLTRNVDCASESKGKYLLQPFDFLLLSGAFPRSTEVAVFDAVADRLNSEAILARLHDFAPDLIVTAIIDAAWDNDVAFACALRQQYPDTPILALGDALIEDRNSCSLASTIDGVIKSPLLFRPEKIESGTRTEVRERACDLGLKQDGYYLNPRKVPELVAFGRPRHELFLNPAYRWPFSRFKTYTTVITTWGCPYQCAYCTASKLPALYRSPEAILDELEEARALGIREIYFGDKSFGVPAGNTRQILEQMIERKMGFSWSSYFHPNQYSPELLNLMRRSGCHTLIIGIETGRVSSLQRFGRRTSNQKIEALIDQAGRLGMDICGDFLFGLPDEDEATMRETLDYALSLKLGYASFNIASPLPGSVVKASALNDRRMTPDDHHFDSVGKGRILSSNRVSATALRKLRNQAVRRFYLRPGYWVRRLRRLRGSEHLSIQLSEMLSVLWKAR